MGQETGSIISAECPVCGHENNKSFYNKATGYEESYVCWRCGYYCLRKYGQDIESINFLTAKPGVWPGFRELYKLAQEAKKGAIKE